MTARSVLLLLALAGCDRPDSGASPPPSPAPAATSVRAAPSSAPATPASAGSDDPLAALSSGPVVREETSVTVDGATEKWRLEWTKTPTPDCVDPSTFATCPCAAFAFGERGDLDLVRTRAGAADERLHLAPLFGESGAARLRRWPVTKADTGKAPGLADLVMRPIETVMKLGDYDHDGRATELVLLVGSEPCGHRASVVVGISRANPSLHVFASADKPDAALVLQHPEDWEKVRAKAAVDLVETACGDHGAESSTSLHVTADGQLHATETTKRCSP